MKTFAAIALIDVVALAAYSLTATSDSSVDVQFQEFLAALEQTWSALVFHGEFRPGRVIVPETVEQAAEAFGYAAMRSWRLACLGLRP